MLQVDPTTSVAQAAYLMMEQAAASLTLLEDGASGRCLTYEDALRGLRRARGDLSVSALATADCADPDPDPADTTSVADVNVSAVFEPETLLASQYADRVRRRAEFDPERRLMIAVLELAVDDYTKRATARDRRGLEMFKEVEAWIEDRDAGWPFAFQSICDALDLDADYLRRGLRAWKERATGRTAERRVEETAATAGEETRRHREAG